MHVRLLVGTVILRFFLLLDLESRQGSVACFSCEAIRATAAEAVDLIFATASIFARVLCAVVDVLSAILPAKSRLTFAHVVVDQIKAGARVETRVA